MYDVGLNKVELSGDPRNWIAGAARQTFYESLPSLFFFVSGGNGV